ncbi:hypothetical protein BD413DRAFT_193770 [Trametes elegans]|nr:hypothetical protein BD413DRAFT_193770 [Trametes elegans]
MESRTEQDMARTRSRGDGHPDRAVNKDEMAGYGRVAPNGEQWSFISTRSRSPSSLSLPSASSSSPPTTPTTSTASTTSLSRSQRLRRSARNTLSLMIRKMASKLHLGHARAADSSASSAASSYTSAQSALSLAHDHRGSISTQRTSLHEWVKTQSEQPLQPDAEPIEARRSRGSYRLTDFIIQRTLGTGSFGRVHLV